MTFRNWFARRLVLRAARLTAVLILLAGTVREAEDSHDELRRLLLFESETARAQTNLENYRCYYSPRPREKAFRLPETETPE